jgi:hypothetical protein
MADNKKDYKIVETHGDISLCEIDGELVYLINGLAYENNQLETRKYGSFRSDIIQIARRGLITSIAQYFMLIGNGLIITRHIFSGLNRPLLDDNNMEADKDKIIHSRKPPWDYKWENRFNDPERISAPSGKVFVVIISKNIKHLDRFPMVYGWVDRWNWIEEDEGLSEAPINWVERYRNRVYTRP